MPDAGEQRIITLEESSPGNANYITAPGEYIQVETVAFESSFEPPVLLQGQVTFGAPTVGTIGYFSTPWCLLDPDLASTIAYFTFARGLTSVPDDAPRVVTPYALAEAIAENTYFMVPLPDLPLGDGQGFSVTVSGVDVTGMAADVHITNGLAVVTILPAPDRLLDTTAMFIPLSPADQEALPESELAA